jgi:hypothetical protein
MGKGLTAGLIVGALLLLAAPASAEPQRKRCDSRWMTSAVANGAGTRFVTSLTPTRAARQSARSRRAWTSMWRDLRRCVRIPASVIGVLRLRNTLFKQLACHAVFAFSERLGGPTWDLEARRPDISWARVFGSVLRHGCNW